MTRSSDEKLGRKQMHEEFMQHLNESTDQEYRELKALGLRLDTDSTNK